FEPGRSSRAPELRRRDCRVESLSGDRCHGTILLSSSREPVRERMNRIGRRERNSEITGGEMNEIVRDDTVRHWLAALERVEQRWNKCTSNFYMARSIGMQAVGPESARPFAGPVVDRPEKIHSRHIP